MATKNKLKTKLKKMKVTRKTLWKGPEEDGITQSLLSKFIVCPMRFRVMMINGLRPLQGFNSKSAFGDMWHLCEEYHADGKDWEKPLKEHAIAVAQYGSQNGSPNVISQIEKWYQVCKRQFPLYVNHWRKHKDVVRRIPVYQEEVFAVDYPLPSGRNFKIRGKLDSVDIVNRKLWLQENKTKGEIDEEKIKSQLTSDLQTMTYLTALRLMRKEKIGGVRYNVVRRPLSGGKFSISQRKGRKTKKGVVGAETSQQFYKRLEEQVIAKNPDFFFMRWNAEVSEADLEKFQKEIFNPILENLYDWWEWESWCFYNDEDPYDDELHLRKFPNHLYRSFRMPYGVWSPLLEGRADDFNHYLDTGSLAGMEKIGRLFMELYSDTEDSPKRHIG